MMIPSARCTLVLAFAGVGLAGCSRPGADAKPAADSASPPAPAAEAPAPPSAGLPADVAAAIRKDFGDSARYVDGSVDLNGDGRDELLVYVVGLQSCGTGGCTLLVFTPDGPGHRVMSSIGVTRLPVRAAATVTKGWRNLIVHVAGGGTPARDVELLSDGKSYPGNPTVPGARVKQASAAGGETVIEDFGSFEDTKRLPAP